jgi:potassium/chloride transporter 9
MLLLVANPRASCPLIDFVNDLKKTGLYVIGHVHTATAMDNYSNSPDPAQDQYPHWLGLVDYLKVKAFVELTVCDNVRDGIRHLIRISGLGGMKPNTVCLGFYDSTPPDDLLGRYRSPTTRLRLIKRRPVPPAANDTGISELCENFPDPRLKCQQQSAVGKSFTGVEYVGMICDALRMNKNVCLFRHFNQFDKRALFAGGRPVSIDVWPVDFFASSAMSNFDSTCLFLLQLACILRMVPGWNKHSTLRVFACVGLGAEHDEAISKKRRLAEYLTALRICGSIQVVSWEDSIGDRREFHEAAESDAVHFRSNGLPSNEHLRRTNGLLHEQCAMGRTAVVFLYLTCPPTDYTQYDQYLRCLQLLTEDLPPTILVHGLHPVTSTTL